MQGARKLQAAAAIVVREGFLGVACSCVCVWGGGGGGGPGAHGAVRVPGNRARLLEAERCVLTKERNDGKGFVLTWHIDTYCWM